MEVQKQTTVANPTQELLLRTLASDASSLEHGSQVPVPQHLNVTAPLEIPSQAGTPQKHANHTKTMLLVLLLVALGAAFYLFLYPQLIAALKPGALVQ